MKPLFLVASLLLFLPVPALAQHPVAAGLNGALMTFSKVPEETAYKARAAAAELLARHVKLRDGNHLSKFNDGVAEKWMETQGLQLGHVTAQTVTLADKANGTAESYFVSVDAKMFRTYDGRTSKWSDWHNGLNLYLPRAIKVARRTDGEWTAHAPTLSNFAAFTARGNLALIPHGSKPFSTANPSPRTTPAKPKNPQVDGTADSPVEKMAGHAIRAAFLAAFIAIFFPLLLTLLIGKRRRAVPPRKPARPAPPPLPTSATLPPPLPEEQAYPEIELMTGNSHLLTPAEQAFHAVLEPLVRHACAISTKVRLADLFSVTPGRGQQAAFNKISRKHIDFVLTEPATSRILCAIELDDSTHNRPDRIERDEFVNELFAANGMPLLRVPFAWTYNVPGLRTELLKAGVPLANAA